MNRLKIFVMNNPAEIFTTYVSILDVMNFLNRTGRFGIFSILAVKGDKSLWIEKATTPQELITKLNDFSQKQ